mgnify:CR=1 FL=1
MALRFLVGETQYITEYFGRAGVVLGLHQPIAEHAEHVAVFEIEFGQVRQYPQRFGATAFVEQQIGDIEIKGRTFGVAVAFVEIQRIEFFGFRFAQATGLRRIRRPGL